MSDARWLEVDSDVKAAVEHFNMAIQLFSPEEFARDGIDGYKAKMAFMHSMQAAHTSLESALTRIMDILQEEKPVGDRWHADLISRAGQHTAGRPAILSPEVVEAADETRRFRNIATRNYGHFDPNKAGPAKAAAEILADTLEGAFRRFRETIDPPEPNENDEPPRSPRNK